LTIFGELILDIFLIFTFFGGHGGMVLVAAGWGA
jgi:hypothetical protein